MRADALYQEASGYHARQLAVGEREYAWMARERARKLSRWIPPGARVLEFGVGTGLNLAALEGRDRLGFDIAAHLAPDVERRGIRFVRDLNVLPAGGLDCVLAHHTLEHTPDPGGVLVQLRALLRPGGRLLVFVPWERERRYRRYDPGEPNHHLFSWNAQTLGNLVSLAGFRVVAVWLGPTGYERFLARLAARWTRSEGVYRIGLWALRQIWCPLELGLVAERRCTSAGGLSQAAAPGAPGGGAECGYYAC